MLGIKVKTPSGLCRGFSPGSPGDLATITKLLDLSMELMQPMRDLHWLAAMWYWLEMIGRVEAQASCAPRQNHVD